MPGKTVNFPNAAGEQLAGILETPDSGPLRGTALFAHCFTCTKNIRAATRISRALVSNGIAVLRFDFTGLGDSEGDFAASGFSSNVADLVEAAKFLGRELTAPSLLIGHSLGGTAVLMAAAQIESCTAVVTIGAPSSAAHVTRQFDANIDELEREAEATVHIGGRPFQLRREFLEDLQRQPMTPRLKNLNRALLVMHSPLDTIVGIDNASALFQAAMHPKSFISLDKADHLLSGEQDAVRAGHLIAVWAEPYLPAMQGVSEAGDPQAGSVTAVTTSQGFRTTIAAGSHRLLADEPKDAGGEDLGPSPYGLLAAALASCTSMTLQMYARHKQIPLESASVSVRHSKLHAQDCADCETSAGRIDEFQRELRLTGVLSEEQRQRMLEIADKCPVHRSLLGEMKIRTRLANSG